MHQKTKRLKATGTSSCLASVKGIFANIRAAQAYWTCHYERRRESQCQRRNRVIDEALNSTAMELNELYDELEHAKPVGFRLSKAAVADETGDVWYGVRCYIAAYKEQVQRVLTEWSCAARASHVLTACQHKSQHQAGAVPIDASVDYGSEVTLLAEGVGSRAWEATHSTDTDATRSEGDTSSDGN